jgi:hypothetical protein
VPKLSNEEQQPVTPSGLLGLRVVAKSKCQTQKVVHSNQKISPEIVDFVEFAILTKLEKDQKALFVKKHYFMIF